MRNLSILLEGMLNTIFNRFKFKKKRYFCCNSFSEQVASFLQFLQAADQIINDIGSFFVLQ